MIRNYFKIAWRNIWKNKLFSAINIVSLAIGLSASFVIGLMIYHDFSFDNFHPNKERVFRLISNYESPEGKDSFGAVNSPLKKKVKEGLPGIETASSLFTFTPYRLGVNNSTYKDPEGLVFTDELYFKIFQYDWLVGNENVLEEPNKVVLTKKKAQKYFPELSLDQIVGKTIIYDDSTQAIISGIVTEFKQKTDLIFDEFISLPTAVQSDMKETVTQENWNSTNSNSQMFVLVNEQSKLDDIQSRLDELAIEHEDIESVKDGRITRYGLQPLEELHFSEFGIFDYGNLSADKSVLIYLSLIAIFLLLLGCVNFINLSTAQATQRAKEIGIRKTLGSSKSQLIYQFLGETFLLTLISGFLSIFLGFALFEIFKNYLAPSFDYGLITRPESIIGILFLLLSVSLLSGIYPALILSRFKPVSVLKSRIFFNTDQSKFRKFLTFFQFGIAQVFIIATLLVGKQINYMMNKDLGFKSDEVVYLNFPYEDDSVDKRYLMKNELKNNPNIKGVSLGSAPPASFRMFGSKLTFPKEEGELNIYFEQLFGDTNYLDFYDIALLAGRKPLNDSIREYVINQSLLSELGFNDPEEAIDKQIRVNNKLYPIVGVMRNFNQRSLKSEIEPMAFVPDIYRRSFSQFTTLGMSINPNNNLKATIAEIEKQWNTIYPESDFNFKFLDETVASFYDQEQKISKLLKWATGLSILISVLGLLGLVIYTTERKTKEIGIRKILGASVLRINLQLCKEFMVPICFAVIIAIPIAWYGLNQWLQDFAYKTNIDWWVFVVSALLIILIAVLVMSFKTIQAASRNPAKSLRTE
ncbi:ABC transporter permease [Psychroflexus montanilacus]|uniref:ABC transporter permease n=1 Tax=Psychroflexus montanilacus TaxID=2873598 RepID=UPI001CCD9BBF|nr:FtsX-like permease family protein [Psychroflexus montanilacus]MBZ9650950.1 ABC transporter permease [Psychroflexus montanilacus]